MPTIRPVILSGGAGTRLWPLSTKELPKQFAPLLPGETLFVKTLKRLDGVDDTSDPIVVTGADTAHLASEAAASAGHADPVMIVEPIGRNTAPAALAAAMAVDPSEVLLILPSDHLIADVTAFQDAVAVGAELAAKGSIVTFGIVPSRPETGFGYIRSGPQYGPGLLVSEFVEKPMPAEAAAFVAGGQHLWNSGMFMVMAGLLVEEAEKLEPGLAADVRAALPGTVDGFIRLAGSFGEIKSISLDHAIMERTERAVVMPMDAGWSDVGSFQTLWEESSKDESDNAISGEVVLKDVTGSLVHAGSRAVAVVGLSDVVVVETPDAVLVVPRDRAQDVGAVQPASD